MKAGTKAGMKASMNETIRTQLNHRTIREFTTEQVSEEIMEQLFAVAGRTATSLGMQSTSIIRVTDPQLRVRLAEIGARNMLAVPPSTCCLLSIAIATQVSSKS